MTDAQIDGLFSDKHPHYTPQWLSEKLVRYLPKSFSGTLVDPACGAGNLLVAAARRLDAASHPDRKLQLVGIDISKRAVIACRASLATILPNGNFAVHHTDFLNSSQEFLGETAVIMNPPFLGYGRLKEGARRRIVKQLELRGRFNLSYAFVRHALELYQPGQLISLLPSNWIYSRGNRFREELDSLKGTWDWVDVGDNAFRGLNVDVGILIWKRRTDRKRRRKAGSSGRSLEASRFDVRYGVATGRDSVFITIAKDPPAFGKVLLAVRGRDVERMSDAPIWVPEQGLTSSDSALNNHIDPKLRRELSERSCVKSGRRGLFEYHEDVPQWFVEGPKLLVPEIVTKRLRVELDPDGGKLPLHSVIAIKVPSVTLGRSLRAHLLSKNQQRRLIREAPRLSGGAVRLQLEIIRDVVERWMRREKSSLEATAQSSA